MTKSSAWLPALIMVAAGFGGGYLFGSAGSNTDEHTSFTGADGISEPETERPRGLEASSSGGPALATTVDPVDTAQLRAALATLPAPHIPRGTGVITGHVKTDEGTPLAGATVTLTPRYAPDERRGTPKESDEESLEEVVRKTVARYWWRRETRQVIETDADGAFRFEGLTESRHQVICTHPGYQINPVDHTMSWQAKAGSRVEFVARAVVSVTIKILLPDGSEPEHAQVSFLSGNANWGTGWTSKNPTVKQKPGAYKLQITAGEGGQYKAEDQTLVLKVGEPQSLTVQLSGQPVLRGNVVYAPGEALVTAQVYVSRLPAGQGPDPALLKSSGQSARIHPYRHTGSDFQFADIAPGRYAIGASRDRNGEIVVMEVVDVGNGLTELDLKIPPLSREQYAIVHVLGPDGDALPDVQVRQSVRSKSGSRSSGGVMVKRPDGVLWVLHSAGTGAADPTASHHISITSTSYGTMEQSYAPGPKAELTFRFYRPATLDIQVGGVSGSRYEGRVSIRLQKVVDGEASRYAGRRRSAKLDGSGHVSQEGQQPGTYEVILEVSRERRSVDVFRKTIELTAGANRISLKLPELATITILGASGSVMLRSKTNPRDRTRRMSRNSWSATAGEDGRVVFDALPPGTYTAYSGKLRTDLSIPGPAEIELR